MCDVAALLLIIKLQAQLLKMDTEHLTTAGWSEVHEKRRLIYEIETRIKQCESPDADSHTIWITPGPDGHPYRLK
jgi:hypothetical protein